MGCGTCSTQEEPVNKPKIITINPNNSYNEKKAETKAETNAETQPTTEPTTQKSQKLTEKEQQELLKEFDDFLTLFCSRMTQKKTIGQGGQAKIRKCYNKKFKRVVVEKEVNLDNCTRSTLGGLGIESLIKEALLLASLDHPNIVKIYDFIPMPPTIIMEYCSLGSLRNVLDKTVKFPMKYKIYLIDCVCKGLKYVHSKEIVHGDLKCDNILLSDEKMVLIDGVRYPTPKLADFGLSQFSNNNVAGGTPGFIAPEIFEGSGLTFKSDIFALGMVMFEILSGLRPIPTDKNLLLLYLSQGKIPCTKEILRKAFNYKDEFLLPGIKNPIYNGFYEIMVDCINDDPSDRPNIEEVNAIVDLLKITLAIIINL